MRPVGRGGRYAVPGSAVNPAARLTTSVPAAVARAGRYPSAVRTCANCGASNADDARFCSSCGASLADAEPAREERKIVSVLFVDLVGFTSSSDGADPEDVRDLLRSYHRRVKETVERFGGTVEKFIGDAVMAVFGAPASHTDDPERAVRAGLRSLEAVADLGREHPGKLAARAAVTTGEAVVAIGTGHERGEALALGDVVNTASRLQSAAPTNRLVVGDETYRATRDAIGYEELPPVDAKGKAEPVLAWLATEPRSAPSERRMLATPMVGRDRELAVLESVWRRTTEERRPHLVTLMGPAGIGKSRLTREFASLVEDGGGRSIHGRCLPYDTPDVYAAFAQQVRQLAGIFEQDPPLVGREKLGAAIDGLFEGAESQDVARSLSLMLGLGVDRPVEERLLLFFSARRLVERLGQQAPTVLVFEDIHWADSAQLDLIAYLASHVRDTPVVLLALARPELFDARPDWGSGLHAGTTISLEPLSEGDSARIVAHLLGDRAPAPVDRLVEIAEGNPLFLEELTAALSEGADVGGALPVTVRAAIAARVDALPTEHRAALLAASVVGRVFWVGTLRALGRGEETSAVLDELEARDFVRREPSSRVHGDVEYRFKHILIRDVCYATLPRAERRAAHEDVARYLEDVAADEARELGWLLAHHWEQAGEPSRAVEYLVLGAERAVEALAEAEAIELFDRALELSTTDEQRTRIELRRGLARARFEDFDVARTDLLAVLPRLEGRAAIEALLALAQSAEWTELTAEVIEDGERALALAERIGADDLAGPAIARISQGLAMRGNEGDIDRALELGERALDRWHANVRMDDLAEHQHLFATQLYWVGRHARALELSRLAKEHAVDPGTAEALLRGGGLEGLVLTALGRYEDAIASFDSVIVVGRDLGRPVRVLLNYSTLVFRELYDVDEARRRSEESLTQPGRSPNFHMPWMNAEVDLVQTDMLSGDVGAAEVRWKRMWDDVVSTPAWERWLLGTRMAATRAEIALASGDLDGAVEWATRAIDMAGTAHRAKYDAVARAALGAALVGLGRRDEGVRELRAAVGVADALGSPTGRWRARAALGRALATAGSDDDAARAYAEATSIVRDVAGGLSPQRAARFIDAPAVAEVVAADA